MSKKVTIGAKPTAAAPASPKQADAWVAGNDEPKTEPMKRLTIDVPVSLHTRIKSQCALRQVNMADEIRALLEKHFPLQ